LLHRPPSTRGTCNGHSRFVRAIAKPRTTKHSTTQQFTLAINLSECLIFLHRPYFARALHESPGDPTRSAFGQSYLVVMERCNVGVAPPPRNPQLTFDLCRPSW
jgi:hypothetical protein